MHPGQGPGCRLHDLGERAAARRSRCSRPRCRRTPTPCARDAGPRRRDSRPPERDLRAHAERRSPTRTTRTPASSHAPEALPPAGGSLPHNNMMPYLDAELLHRAAGRLPAARRRALARPAARRRRPTAPSCSSSTRARARRSWRSSTGTTRRSARSSSISSAPRTSTTAANYPGATLDVIEVDGERAGRLYVHRGEDDIRIMDIAVAPELPGARDRDRADRGADRRGARERALGLDPRRDAQPGALALRPARLRAGRRARRLRADECESRRRRPRRPRRRRRCPIGTMKISRAPRRRVLEAVDALGEHGLGGTAEEERERRPGAGGVLRGSVGVVKAGLDQLELEAASLAGVEHERLAHGGGEAGRRHALEHAAMLRRRPHPRVPGRDRVTVLL